MPPKYATNVILHGSGSVSNNSSKPQKLLRPPSPRTDLSLLKAKTSVDMAKGTPSPKSSTVPLRFHQRKSPHLFQDHNNTERTSHLGRPEEHAPWLSLSNKHENYDSFDAEQQSNLSVVLQPEHHRQFRQLIENQKLQSATLGSSTSLSNANFGSGSLRPLRKAVPGEILTVDPAVDGPQPAESVAHNAAGIHHSHLATAGHMNYESMDEAMSDRTQPVEYSNGSGQSVEQLSVAEILSMQNLLQRELERRIGHTHTSIYPAVNANATEMAVDVTAQENRRGFKRSKSGGNESAFVKAAPSPSTITTVPQQQQIRVTNPLSKLTAALADQHDNDDPELMLAYGSQSQSTRPGSRASGAFHPHDKMFLANHMRSTSALPCLSPAQLPPPAANSPIDNGNGYYSSGGGHGGFSSHGSSRPSSRPPSRGPFGGLSNSHNGHLLMSLLPADQTNSDGQMVSSTAPTMMAGSPSLAGIDVSHLNLSSVEAAGPETTVTASVSSPMAMGQMQAQDGSRDTTAAATVVQRHNISQVSQQQQQHASRGELVLSPCSAFDDISLGSASLSSSISSKAQRRRRNREMSEGSNSSVKGPQGFAGLPESISISSHRAISSSVHVGNRATTSSGRR